MITYSITQDVKQPEVTKFNQFQFIMITMGYVRFKLWLLVCPENRGGCFFRSLAMSPKQTYMLIQSGLRNMTSSV